MKILLLVMMSAMGLSFNAGEPTVKTVDTENSQVEWKGYKVLGSHEGTLNLKGGELVFEGGVLVGGQFSIDMTSIATTDLEGEMAGKLVGHLSSPDFFSVKEYPTADFIITKVVSRGLPGDYKVTGDLTIKGLTKSITFKAQVDEKSAQADVQIDRSEFNVQYGSGTFFQNLGDKTIYDEFDLNIKLSLK